jgi:thiosulfate/3-mercaptopyruvate sulfurtransferase
MPVETGPAPIAAREPTEPYVGTPNEAAIATIAEVEAALDSPDVVLVDARSPEEYAQGHIPGAINIPFTDNAEMTQAAAGGRPRSCGGCTLPPA